ncbi:hypothetical protein CSUI_011493, partial [Cystoisospora suis]
MTAAALEVLIVLLDFNVSVFILPPLPSTTTTTNSHGHPPPTSSSDSNRPTLPDASSNLHSSSSHSS